MSQTGLYSLVWFKRDLRWQDHAALAQAAQKGPVRCIYVIEPNFWLQPDCALQHFEFVHESLQALDAHLRTLGGCIEIHHGELPEVLERIWRSAPFSGLYSHEETGNGFTYRRDLEVAAWCKSKDLVWKEFAQFGVVRRLKDRNVWQSEWERHMASPRESIESMTFWRPPCPEPLSMPAPNHLKHNPPQRQLGGRPQALKTLHNFLNARSVGYRGGISSPLSAPNACSRLSAYLAYGCISMREVVQETRAHLAHLPAQASRHRAGLTAFMSRLYWHCHFIQKLESEPAIEWRNMHRGYDDLREQAFNPVYFEALKEARTGWPMVDASVTMLRETGWLNFRMRAMLVSVAAYPLWLHWRPVGEWLATQFLDYEPGIHWSQMQMQSGTTGINLTRVYNPIKQAQDHDPKGIFVRRWLPAMKTIPDRWLFEPWKMRLDLLHASAPQGGSGALEPLVDLALATKASKDKVHARRKNADVRSGNKAVIDKHASRKRSSSVKKRADSTQAHAPEQLGFNF
jgi:deoxyribodipyrimidine photo-lyase